MDSLALIDSLHREGVRRAFVWMRHGARQYDRARPESDRFMGLTAEGKRDALEFGRGLPAASPVRFFSSSIGRCIETAYQIEKGCIERGQKTQVNKLVGRLTGFFVGDPVGSLVHMQELGKARFFRAWFGGELPESMMADAGRAAKASVAYVRERLSEGAEGLDVGVSHDWNLYLLRAMCLGQHIDDVGEVVYLDSMVFFEQDGQLHAATRHGRGTLDS